MNNHHYMRKLVLLMLAVVATVAADAQTLKFGYLSYREAIKSMPGYAVARQNLESLRNQYSEETKRSEEEFNQKYELFLEAQGELAAPILKKRQAELQELLARSVDFKKEASRLLAKAKAEMFAPLHKELDALLARIASERGYAFILRRPDRHRRRGGRGCRCDRRRRVWRSKITHDSHAATHLPQT